MTEYLISTDRQRIWGGEFINVDRTETAAFVTLNRAEKANAYNKAMLLELETALDLVEQEDFAATVFGSSSNKYYCAGADLNEIARRCIEDILALKSSQIFDRISRMTSVAIAAVTGAAAGGGVELALACDLRVASINASFSFPETGLGMIPAAGGVMRLPAIAGLSLAKDMILTGRIIRSREALRYGLVSRVFSDEEFMGGIDRLCSDILSRDRVANLAAKHILNNNVGLSDGSMMINMAQGFLEMRKANGSERLNPASKSASQT